MEVNGNMKSIINFVIIMLFQVFILCLTNTAALCSTKVSRIMLNIAGLFIVECYGYWKYNIKK